MKNLFVIIVSAVLIVSASCKKDIQSDVKNEVKYDTLVDKFFVIDSTAVVEDADFPSTFHSVKKKLEVVITNVHNADTGFTSYEIHPVD